MQLDGNNPDGVLGLGVENRGMANRNAKPSVGWWRRASGTTDMAVCTTEEGNARRTEHDANEAAATRPTGVTQGWELPLLLCRWEARIFARLDDMRDQVCMDAHGRRREEMSVKGEGGDRMHDKGVGGNWSTMVEGRLSAIAEDITHLHEAVQDLSQRLSSTLQKEKEEDARQEAETDLESAKVETGMRSGKKRGGVKREEKQMDQSAFLQKEVHEAMTACTIEVRRVMKEGLAARERSVRATVTNSLRGMNENMESVVKGAINDTAGEMVDGMLTRVYTVIAKAIGEVRELALKVDAHTKNQRLQDEKQGLVPKEDREVELAFFKSDFVRGLVQQTAAQAAQAAAQQMRHEILGDVGKTLAPLIAKELQQCLQLLVRSEVERVVPQFVTAFVESTEIIARSREKTLGSKHMDRPTKGQGYGHQLDGKPDHASALLTAYMPDVDDVRGVTNRDERNGSDSVADDGDRVGGMVDAVKTVNNEKEVRSNLGLHRLWEDESVGTEGWDESDGEKVNVEVENVKEDFRATNTHGGDLSQARIENARIENGSGLGDTETWRDPAMRYMRSRKMITPTAFDRTLAHSEANHSKDDDHWRSDKFLL